MLVEGGMAMVLVTHEIGSSDFFTAKLTSSTTVTGCAKRVRRGKLEGNVPGALTCFRTLDGTAVLLCFVDEA